MRTIKLLRGRVAIREDRGADYRHFSSIIVPPVSNSDDPKALERARTWHRGRVLAVGAPPLHYKSGVEWPVMVKPGDEVIFHFEHNEKHVTLPWVDNEECVYCPIWCVDAVLERTSEPWIEGVSRDSVAT